MDIAIEGGDPVADIFKAHPGAVRVCPAAAIILNHQLNQARVFPDHQGNFAGLGMADDVGKGFFDHGDKTVFHFFIQRRFHIIVKFNRAKFKIFDQRLQLHLQIQGFIVEIMNAAADAVHGFGKGFFDLD